MKFFIVFFLFFVNILIFAEVNPNAKMDKGEWNFNNKVYKLESPPLFWQSPIKLPDKFIVDSTLNITINNYPLTRGEHYIYNREDGLIYFNINIKKSDEVLVFYRTLPIKIKDYFYLDSMNIFTAEDSTNLLSKNNDIKKDKDLDFVRGESNLSFDVDKGGFNMNRFIDLTISGIYEDSININGHIYDENSQDKYMFEKEINDVQDLQLKVDNGHGYFVGGDYFQEDTSMIFYTSRKLRGAKGEYRGDIKTVNYDVNGFIGGESNVSIHERINLIFGVKGPYEIGEKNYFIDKIKIYFKGRELKENIDYVFDADKGFIYLKFYFDPGSYIDIEYFKEDNSEGRNLGGGFLSFQKNFAYVDMNVIKGFGGVDKSKIIKYLPGDTLAVVSGEEIVNYSDINYGAYKKNSKGVFSFYEKSQLNPSDTLFLLHFYKVEGAGNYKVDEVKTYHSNGAMEVHEYDPTSTNSIYEIGRVVRVKDDFVLLNNKFGLTADSILNIDLSKAELFRQNSINNAFNGHLDISLNRKLGLKNLPFDKLMIAYNTFYKDNNYYSIDNFRDKDFYYRNWNMEDYEFDMLENGPSSFDKSEWENRTSFNIKFSKLDLSISPALLHFGNYKKAYYNISKINTNISYKLSHEVEFVNTVNKYFFDNWSGEYSKFNQKIQVNLLNKYMLITPFFYSDKNELGKLDSIFYRNHYGVKFRKKMTKNIDIDLTFQKYHDKIESKLFNIRQINDTLNSNQILSNFLWKDSVNNLNIKIDYFGNELKDLNYTNIVFNFYRNTKKYNASTSFTNSTELLESSIYQHMFVGKLNGSYTYDSTSNEFIFVGADMGDVELYEESRVVNDLVTNKNFSMNISTDYMISPFFQVDMLEISNKKNLFPELPSYENILSRSELNSNYIIGFSIFKIDEELKIFRKYSELFKRYMIFDNNSNLYDKKYNLLYNFEDGYYVSKIFKSKDISTKVDFVDKDLIGVFYSEYIDTTYVVNRASINYLSTYNYNNILDFIFGNGLELNRELKFKDNYEMLNSTLGVSIYYKAINVSLLNKFAYRFRGDDSLNSPFYFNTYKKGFNYDLSINGKSKVSKKISFGLNFLSRFRKGEEPWFQAVLDGSYSF